MHLPSLPGPLVRAGKVAGAGGVHATAITDTHASSDRHKVIGLRICSFIVAGGV